MRRGGGRSWADHGTASSRVYCSHIPFNGAVALEKEEAKISSRDQEKKCMRRSEEKNQGPE